MKEHLRSGLRSLPRPRNDYEIVVPEEDTGTGAIEESQTAAVDSASKVEDQADVDSRNLAIIQQQS